jgi:hypothetical protein
MIALSSHQGPKILRIRKKKYEVTDTVKEYSETSRCGREVGSNSQYTDEATTFEQLV